MRPGADRIVAMRESTHPIFALSFLCLSSTPLTHGSGPTSLAENIHHRVRGAGHRGGVGLCCALLACTVYTVLQRKVLRGSLRHLPAGARDRTMDACQKAKR